MAKRYLLYPVGGLLFLTFTIPYITSAQPVDETPLFSTTPIWTRQIAVTGHMTKVRNHLRRRRRQRPMARR